MLFADTGTVLGVPDPPEGGYNPYDEQRMLELEDGEGGEPYDPAMVSEDILLSSGGEEETATAKGSYRTKATESDIATATAATADNVGTAESRATRTYTGLSATANSNLHPFGTHTRGGDNTMSSDCSKQSNANTKESVQLPSEYLANKHATRLRNGGRSLHDGTEIFRVENGTFFNEGDNRGRLCSMIFDREHKYNVS